MLMKGTFSKATDRTKKGMMRKKDVFLQKEKQRDDVRVSKFSF